MSAQHEAAARIRTYLEIHKSTPNLSMDNAASINYMHNDDLRTTELTLNDLEAAADALAPRMYSTVTQYGIRFPDGSVVWAADQDAVTFGQDGPRVRPTMTMAAVAPGEYPVDLAKVVAGSDNGAARSHFINQAEELAAAARIEADEYVDSLKIIRRTIRLSINEWEDLEFEEPAVEATSS